MYQGRIYEMKEGGAWWHAKPAAILATPLFYVQESDVYHNITKLHHFINFYKKKVESSLVAPYITHLKLSRMPTGIRLWQIELQYL